MSIIITYNKYGMIGYVIVMGDLIMEPGYDDTAIGIQLECYVDGRGIRPTISDFITLAVHNIRMHIVGGLDYVFKGDNIMGLDTGLSKFIHRIAKRDTCQRKVQVPSYIVDLLMEAIY